MPFTFVDAGASNDRDNRRKIRKHLSVFHTLQRRQRDVQKQKNAAELRNQSVVAAGPLTWRHRNEDEEEAISAVDQSTTLMQNSPNPSGIVSSVQSNATMSGALIGTTDASLSNLLGQARIDSFSTYPIPRDAELDATADFYVNGLGPHLYGYASNGSVDLFRHRGYLIASQDPAAFHANMLMASINLDLIDGRSLPGMRTLRHRVEAIRLINERLAKGMKFLDESTIYTIIMLTCLQKIWGAVGHKEVQSGGLQQVLVKCGGLRMLRQYPLLEHTLYSIALVTPRLLSFGAPNLYSVEQEHLTPEGERRAVSAELIDLLDSIASREHSWPISMLAFAFQPGSPLHDILIASPETLIPTATRHTLEASERSRLSVLLHFHCMLARLPEHAEIIKWARKLNKMIRDVWMWRNSLRMAQYMIVKADDSASLEDPDLAWQVLRLVEISASLPQETYLDMKEYMFALLSQSYSAPKLNLRSIRKELRC